MKLIAAILSLAALATAASWDGTRGDLTISTSSRTVQVGPFVQPVMVITVKCVNLVVSAVRVAVTVHNGEFTSTESRIIQLNALHSGTATFPNTSEEFVTAPPILTPLFDGASVAF